MLDYIDKILNTFDKVDSTIDGNNSSAAPAIIFMVNEDYKNLIWNKMWSFITWCQKYYSIPIGPDQTPATKFYS